MFFQKLPTDLLLCLLLAGACLAGFKFWENRIRLDERDKTVLRLDKAWRKTLATAEDKALDALNKLRIEHAQNYALVLKRANALSDELRKRPTRAELALAPRPVAGPCPVCTGEGLAREDGGFLAGEAAGAAALQLDLFKAIGSYDSCRKALEEVTGGTK